MKFCSICGRHVELRVPDGDNRLRFCCAHCGTVHYENPKLVVGTICVLDDRVLLCRRAIEPRYDFWTLPAGFMENDETTSAGAQRETIEEAGANVALGPLFAMIDVPHVNQVHLFFRATMLDARLDPGPESLDAGLFREEDIPWDALAFRTVAQALRWFFADRRNGAWMMHTGAIDPRSRWPGEGQEAPSGDTSGSPMP